MFEDLAQQLPAYEDFAQQVMTDAKRSGGKLSHPRLFKALSNIYVDLLHFCQDVIALFPTQSGDLQRFTTSYY
jgi:hypothetical protein